MRIALFTEVFLPKIDGVVTRIIRTLEALGELGHEVLVFAPGDPPHSYAGHQVQRVRSVPARLIYPEIKVGLPTPRIARQMVAFQPDVVHAVNPIALAAFGVLSAGHRSLPLLASFHTDVPHYTEKLRLGWLRSPAQTWIRFLHNKAEVNLCTSGPMVAQARSIGINNVHLWPKAVDTHAYRPEYRSRAMRNRLTDGHPDAPLIIYVGRMSMEKDLADLVEPLRRMPDARLALVGSGPHRRELERQFAGTNTVFTGYLSGAELATAYASADVFAFPSTTETLGLVALESMAAGVPVVGADAGGIPFVIHDGVDGFLVPAHDPDALVDRLTRLGSDAGLRARMGAAARQEAERHSWRSATEALVQYYAEAIRLNRKRR